VSDRPNDRLTDSN